MYITIWVGARRVVAWWEVGDGGGVVVWRGGGCTGVWRGAIPRHQVCTFGCAGVCGAGGCFRGGWFPGGAVAPAH